MTTYKMKRNPKYINTYNIFNLSDPLHNRVGLISSNSLYNSNNLHKRVSILLYYNIK